MRYRRCYIIIVTSIGGTPAQKEVAVKASTNVYDQVFRVLMYPEDRENDTHIVCTSSDARAPVDCI